MSAQPLPNPPPQGPAPKAQAPAAPLQLAVPEGGFFFDRDLSWLEFNARVLAQADDDQIPLLERVKFLAIFASNLDEFFMKRLGILRRQAALHNAQAIAGSEPAGSVHGGDARELFAAVRARVAGLKQEQVAIWQEHLRPALEGAGIRVQRIADLPQRDRRWLTQWFHANVFAALTPLVVDPGHRFPFISNMADNLGVLLETRPGAPAVFARVKVPGGIKRFVELPAEPGETPKRFVCLHELIRQHLPELFPGVKILHSVLFRVIRSFGIQRDDLDAGNILQSVQAELKQRRFARAVALEVEPGAPIEFTHELLDKLNLDPQDLYELPADEYRGLMELADLPRADLKDAPWRPRVPKVLEKAQSDAAFFEAIRRRDLLVHHPYDSFTDSVQRFVDAAANDPDVVAIKQTLYRTSPDSPFVESLVRAAEGGKQVACLVELRARFDEDRNVRFARRLEKAGVHVAYGVVGLKAHCKIILVVRREQKGLRCYGHIGTGNYHPRTAQLYTDLGLLTADPQITTDLVTLFNALTGVAGPREYRSLLVAPFAMRDKFEALIDREIEAAKRGEPARIFAKINSLEDRAITRKLYEASNAGVKVELIVRGFCSLRPGLAGVSENIRVWSVIGRFLEHSRVFHFASGHEDPLKGEWYIGSADWMYRNLSNRVEAIVPVRDARARARLLRLVEVMRRDHQRAWDLGPDGSYARRALPPGAPADSPEALGTFAALMHDAAQGI